MALLFNPIHFAEDTQKVFNTLSKNVRTAIAKGEYIDARMFSESIRTIGDSFEHQGQKYIMNYKGAKLAKELTDKKQFNLASIIYSFLIKNNEQNPVLCEDFAKKGLKLARRVQDPIHIMARLDNLNNLYRKTEYGSKKHIKTLVEEKEILRKIVKKYKNCINQYNTISRQALPKEHYEFMLCGIKMEIAKIMLEKNPLMAILELESAERMLHKYGKGTLTDRIQMLLAKAYSRL